jgi:nucleoside-diphosphate kinase
MDRDIEQTLAIIKPDAFSFRLCGAIIGEIEKSDLDIIGAKIVKLTHEQAEKFYAVHKGRAFFERLMTFMTSGPIMVLALQGEDAIRQWRDIMGCTDPEEAREGTIRKLFASDVTFNAVHGSDSRENAKSELEFFFQSREIVSPLKQ